MQIKIDVLTIRNMLFVATILIFASCGSNTDVEDSSPAVPDSTVVAPTTTLSTAEQTVADEQLIRQVFYEGQQHLLLADVRNVTAETFIKNRQLAIDSLFPPYRQFVTDAVLDACITSDTIKYSSWTVGYTVPQLGSSISTPDWILETKFGKSFRPSDYGRTYMIRVKQFDFGFQPDEIDQDIHFSVIDGKAYYFTNFDSCVSTS
jgi:hypothetical protein